MKKLWKPLAILLVAALAASLSLFAACDNGTEENVAYEVKGGLPESYSGKVTVVIDDPSTDAAEAYFQVDYTELAEGSKAIAVLDLLQEQGKIFYDGTDSQYGMFLSGIGTMNGQEKQYIVQADDGAHTFVAFYTNVAVDMDGAAGVMLGDVRVESSLQGVTSMTVEDGAVIYITEGSY